MRKFRFMWAAVAFAAFGLCGCSDDYGDEHPQYPGGGGQEPLTGVMCDLLLTGHVHDNNGNPVAGVQVKSGTSTTITDASGFFVFSKIEVVDNRSVVRFSKDGYFDVVRSRTSENGHDWEVVMCSKNDGDMASSTSYSSQSGQQLVAGGMKINMPEDGYMVDKTGKPYTGEVKADMVYLDPNNENFSEMMPGGDMAATRTDGSDALLVSYGMTAVNMTDGAGNKLQLKEGSKAQLTFPIPEGMSDNLPETIPLWSFNESTGLWVEEGSARLEGNVYVGEVTHFSWVNLDIPKERAKVYGYVRDQTGRPVSGLPVTLGQIGSKETDATGYYECYVPAERAFEIKVKPAYYGNYKNVFARPVMPLAKGEERAIDIVLPKLYNLKGRIVNQGGGTNIASVWLEYGTAGRKTKSVTSKEDGTFSMHLPEGYTGTAVVNVRTSDGETVSKQVTIGNADMNIGDIVIMSATGSGGILNVNLSNGSAVSIQIPNAEPGMGVMVVDDKLLYDSETEDGSYTAIQLEGYNSSNSNYSNVMFAVGNEANGEEFGSLNTAKANVSRKGNSFIFDISGKGFYYNDNTEIYDEEASFSTQGLTLDMLFISKSFRNVLPVKAGLPSFTPQLSTPAPYVLLLTESAICENGGIVCYNGNNNDYQTLKKSAQKAGLKLVSEDNYGDGYASAYFYNNKKLVLIDFDSSAPAIGNNFNIFDDDVQIYIMVLDGVDEDELDNLSSTSSYKLKNLAHKASKIASNKVLRQ